jgi:hypothetical protein
MDMSKTRQTICISKKHFDSHARFIPRWKYRFSSDQRSQATLGPVSTGVGDQPGTQGDLAFLFLLFPQSFLHLSNPRGNIITLTFVVSLPGECSAPPPKNSSPGLQLVPKRAVKSANVCSLINPGTQQFASHFFWREDRAWLLHPQQSALSLTPTNRTFSLLGTSREGSQRAATAASTHLSMYTSTDQFCSQVARVMTWLWLSLEARRRYLSRC